MNKYCFIINDSYTASYTVEANSYMEAKELIENWAASEENESRIMNDMNYDGREISIYGCDSIKPTEITYEELQKFERKESA